MGSSLDEAQPKRMKNDNGKPVSPTQGGTFSKSPPSQRDTFYKAPQHGSLSQSQDEANNMPHVPLAASSSTDQQLTSHPFVIEICAGSARVTLSLQKLGLTSSFGVDRTIQKNGGKTLVADLTTEAGQSLCNLWLSSPNLLGVFIAPPCGTCSRARGIPIWLPNGRCIAGPVPLRSDEFPNGLKGLRWIDRTRVSSANRLYHYVTEVALNCIKRNLVVCIENPRNSLYWRTSFFRPLRKFLQFTAHQACAYGSMRPKHTVLAHNNLHFNMINKACPGLSDTHVHKPWGFVGKSKKFATSEETAYPMQLAYTIAFAFAQAAIDKGWRPPQQSLTPPDEVSYHFLRSLTGLQPKASKLPPVVSEFKTIQTVHLQSGESPPVQPGKSLTQPWNGLPVGACLLAKPPARLTKGADKETNDVANNPNYTEYHFGIFRSPQQFVEDAVQVGHPINNACVLPKVLKDAIHSSKNCDPGELAKERLATLKMWMERANLLKHDEDALHSSLPPPLARILKPKRLVLFREMLTHYGYPDVGVVDEMTEGTTLTGVSPHVSCFEQSFKPAKLTEGDLAACAASSRHAMFRSTRSSGDQFIDEEVHTKTLAEVESGWLEGPIPFDSLPVDAVVNRRFGIKQSSGESVKVRLIDDFSASGVNSSVQVSSMPKLHTLDVVAALSLELSRPPMHEPWMGKTVDLSAAYRQLGISPQSERVSYVSVYNPHLKKPEVYLMRALPFGASRSVYSFLRASHALWWLGCVALGLTWSSFFDDFVTFCRSSECKLVAGIIVQYFKLLGWQVSSGDKDLPFAPEFKALGVEIDLKDCQLGFIVFKNTAKRIHELVETISELLANGRMSQPEALSLRGRMQFAKAQIWGRAARLCLNAVTEHAYSSCDGSLSSATCAAMSTFRECLLSSPPRRISGSLDKPWFVFTDASFQPNDVDSPCGLGGVLVGPDGRQVSAFSITLDFACLERLGFPKKKTVIFEAELVALILGMHLWSKFISQSPCVFFVDNNSARDIAISGHARTEPGSTLVGSLLMLEDALAVIAWYSRVASASNIADAPSRGSSDGIHVPYVDKRLVIESLNEILENLPTG